MFSLGNLSFQHLCCLLWSHVGLSCFLILGLVLCSWFCIVVNLCCASSTVKTLKNLLIHYSCEKYSIPDMMYHLKVDFNIQVTCQNIHKHKVMLKGMPVLKKIKQGSPMFCHLFLITLMVCFWLSV